MYKHRHEDTLVEHLNISYHIANTSTNREQCPCFSFRDQCTDDEIRYEGGPQLPDFGPVPNRGPFDNESHRTKKHIFPRFIDYRGLVYGILSCVRETQTPTLAHGKIVLHDSSLVGLGFRDCCFMSMNIG